MSDDLKWVDLLQHSLSFRKLTNYVSDLCQKKSFKLDVTKMRRKYEIPTEGYPWQEPPKRLPDKWQNTNDYHNLKKEISKLCAKHNVPRTPTWIGTIEHFVFFDEVEFYLHPKTSVLFMVSDDNRKKDFPVSLNISPYASKREILDFVARMYKTEIEPLQKKYAKSGVVLGSSKDKRRRSFVDKFIRKNPTMKASHIARFLNEKLGTRYGYAEINKIRHELRKRSEEA